MAQPKRRTSKSRQRTRKQANRKAPIQVGRDPSTGHPVLPHRVDPETGMYRGRQVLTIKEED